MKKSLKVILAIFLFLIGIGLYFYFHPKKAIEITVPEFKNIEKVHITFLEDTALIDADILFRNSSFMKLNVDSFIYNVKLDTLTLLSKAQDLDMKLLPSETDTVHLPIALPFKRLMKEIKDLQKQDSVQVTYDLRLVYSTWFGKTSLPYKKTIRIAVPIPPKIEIEKLEYKERHKNIFTFNAHVRIINKGKLDLHVSEIRYLLTVKDNFTAKGKEEKEIHLSPGSEQTVVLPIKIEFEHLFKTLINVATDNDQVNYHLKIKALAQIDKLSTQKTEIEIEKEGITELKK